jgi:hypothetical protein
MIHPKKTRKINSKRLQNPPLNKIDKNNRVNMGYICKLVTGYYRDQADPHMILNNHKDEDMDSHLYTVI